MLPLKGVLSWLDASTMSTNLRRGSSSTYWALSPLSPGIGSPVRLDSVKLGNDTLLLWSEGP